MTSDTTKNSIRRRGVRALLKTAPFMIVLTPQLAYAFPSGDVFVSVSSGQVKEFTPAGAYVRTLNTGTGGYTTGSTFDSAGNLYVTDFSANQVSKFDPTGALLGFFGSGNNVPEAILFDGAGNAYVTSVGGGGIRKFAADGTFLEAFPLGRTDWMDLSADQCTMLYDHEGGAVQRYNVCTHTPLPNFTNAGGDYAMRILPTGGVLVADSSQIDRFDAAGTLVQSYSAAGEGTWFALNLDPDGTTFWSANFGSSNVYRFDIATGAIVSHFNAGTGTYTVFGLAINGEITVSAPPKPPSCALLDVIPGPPKQLTIKVEDATAGLESITVTSATNATVSVPPFALGEKGSLVVMATKVDQSLGSHVALHITGVDGKVTDCDPLVPGEPQPVTVDPPTHGAGGCNVGPTGGTAGLSGLLGALVGLALFRRRRAAAAAQE